MHTPGHVPQSFCFLEDTGLNPASLTCQLSDLSPVAAPLGLIFLICNVAMTADMAAFEMAVKTSPDEG